MAANRGALYLHPNGKRRTSPRAKSSLKKMTGCQYERQQHKPHAEAPGAVAGLVGIEGGVVSGVINLESSGVEASDWRPRHAEPYHEA